MSLISRAVWLTAGSICAPFPGIKVLSIGYLGEIEQYHHYLQAFGSTSNFKSKTSVYNLMRASMLSVATGIPSCIPPTHFSLGMFFIALFLYYPAALRKCNSAISGKRRPFPAISDHLRPNRR